MLTKLNGHTACNETTRRHRLILEGLMQNLRSSIRLVLAFLFWSTLAFLFWSIFIFINFIQFRIMIIHSRKLADGNDWKLRKEIKNRKITVHMIYMASTVALNTTVPHPLKQIIRNVPERTHATADDDVDL